MENQSNQFQCPYSDEICDKINPKTHEGICHCSQCEHFNGGIPYEKNKTEKPLKSLSIGFITTKSNAATQFINNNKIHKVHVINSFASLYGVSFDTIIKGDSWDEVNKSVVDIAYSRVR